LIVDFAFAQQQVDASVDLAERWASEDEDVEVQSGEFSSKHYSAKSSSSASNAALSALSAANSADEAAASLEDFQGQYYGSLSEDPTEDPNGNAPAAGDFYFNTIETTWRVFDGSAWKTASALANASSTPLPGYLILRDAEGRAQVAGPSAEADIATKGYVDDSAPVRIAVLGDSFTTVLGHGLDWPKALENLMHISGVPTEIYHLAHGGWTYRKAASTDEVDLIFDGMNTLDYLIELAPDIAIVSLGFNDIFTDSTDTLSQVQINAENVFDAIRTQLPNTFVIYATQLVYDNVNFPSGTTKNKGVIPFLQSIFTGSGMGDESLLNDNLNITRQTQLDNFRTLDTYVKNYINTTFSSSKHSQFNLNIWRAARLGLSYDSLHLNVLGQRYIAICAYEHFKDNSQIKSMFPAFANLGLYDYVSDPDTLWTYGMTASGDGYTIKTGTNEWVWWVRAQGFNAHELERRWFRSGLESISPEISINASTFNLAEKPPYEWVVRNALPYTPVRVALDGVDKGQIATTDAYGYAFSVADAYNALRFIDADAPGTYDITYTVGAYSKTFEITVSNPQHKKFYSAFLNTSNTSKTTWVAAGLSGSIAPWNTKNKIIIRGSINCGLLKQGVGDSHVSMDIRLKRGSTVIATWDYPLGGAIVNLLLSQCNFEWVDSPNATSSQTYSWEFKLSSDSVDGTAFIGGVGERLCTMMLEQIEDVG
jgi:lysophospholipase L1-like esterase